MGRQTVHEMLYTGICVHNTALVQEPLHLFGYKDMQKHRSKWHYVILQCTVLQILLNFRILAGKFRYTSM